MAMTRAHYKDSERFLSLGELQLPTQLRACSRSVTVSVEEEGLDMSQYSQPSGTPNILTCASVRVARSRVGHVHSV